MARRTKKLTIIAVLLGTALCAVVLFSSRSSKDDGRGTVQLELPERKVDQLSLVVQLLKNEKLDRHNDDPGDIIDIGQTRETNIEREHTPSNITEGKIIITAALGKEDTINNKSEANDDVTDTKPIGLDDEHKWEEEQERRKATLRDACAKHPSWNMSIESISHNSRLLWPFIYDDKYKIIYCTICKVASTTWKSVFLVLMGKYNSTEEVDFGQWYNLDRSLHILQNLRNPKEIEKRLRTYKKFIFVREPFSRELSGYRNKLYKRNNYYQKTVGTKIIRQFRKNPDREALQTGVGVTFTEFVKHLTQTTSTSLDIHWRPMYKMVLPCSIDYDYIGHLETSDWDTQNILKKTGINQILEVPKVATNLSSSNIIFNSFYEELDQSLVQDMYNTFKFDSELFGYELPELVAKKLGNNS